MSTVAHLFSLAIAAEHAAAARYHELAARFAHVPEAAAFWEEYAADEMAHAQVLERLRNELPAEKLTAAADPEYLRQARRSAAMDINQQLSAISTLEDAYQLAHELEHSETNTVFEFLITHLGATQQAHPFLRSQLSEHVAKIERGFPARYAGRASRQVVSALPPSTKNAPR